MLCLMRGAIAALFAVVVASAALAEESSTAELQRKDVLELLSHVESAFASSDALGLANCFAPGGEFVGPAGAVANGRDAIQKVFAEGFSTHTRASLHLDLQRFRLVSDNLALVDAIADVKPAMATGSTPLVSFVIVREEGHWVIESLRETLAHMPSQTNQLKDLEWLIGDWVSATSSSGITLHAECGWGLNRSFLMRKFQTDAKDAAKAKELFVHGGTEVIGWDPRMGTFRSWIFDSDGGFGENIWIRNGSNWLIRYSGTLADGSLVSATQVLTKVDDDTITIQSKDRTINGTAQPDIPETALTRRLPQAPVLSAPLTVPQRPASPPAKKAP